MRWFDTLAVRARTTLSLRDYAPGLLSIVVPAYNVERHIDDCLRSIRGQNYRSIEILVVNDDSTDNTTRIARAHARKDPRVRVLGRGPGGVGAARNNGIAAAHGEFLTVIDADNVVSPGGYESALAALQLSGSDFCVLLYDRLVKGRRRPAAAPVRKAHQDRLLHCTLDGYPQIQVNSFASAKVYRRRFWDRADLSYPDAAPFEDQSVSAAAFALCSHFDVLPKVGVSWRVQDDQASTSSQERPSRDLHTQIIANRRSFSALEHGGKSEASMHYAIQRANFELDYFLRQLLDSNQEYWDLLRTLVDELREHIDEDAFVESVKVQVKVLCDLVTRDRRADAEKYLRAWGRTVERSRTTVVESGVACALPIDDSAGVPPSYFLLSGDQLAPQASILRARWTSAYEIVIDGWAYIRNIDLAENPTTVSLRLRDADGHPQELVCEPLEHQQIDEFSKHHYCDYRPGGFRARLDVRGLLHRGPWRFEAAIETAGFQRTALLNATTGTAVVAQTSRVENDIFTLGKGTSGQLTLSADRCAVVATRAHRESDESLRVDVSGRKTGTILLVMSTQGRRTEHRVDDVSGEDLSSLLLSPRALIGRPTWPSPVDLSLLAEDAAGVGQPIAAPGRSFVLPDGLHPIEVTSDSRGHLLMRVRDMFVRAASTDASGDTIRIALETHGLDIEEYEATLESSKFSTIAQSTHISEGLPQVLFSMMSDRPQAYGNAIPSGTYHLSLHHRETGQRIAVDLDDELLATLPIDFLTPSTRVTLIASNGHAAQLALKIGAPLRPDERGPRNQQRLRESNRVEVADRPCVFFRSLYGEVANCNGLAIHDELLRRGSPLELFWSVRDRSVPVPEGGTAIIEGSREWHAVIARARYHMVNVHQLDWFAKPAGQVMIQTMHGYPYKIMGHDWWEKGPFSRAQVANYDRRAREWDYFVSPARYATPLLERAFLTPADAHPKILEIGYPRNDELLSAHAQATRQRVRDEFGVRPDQTVVLYAPTFRDYLAENDRTAEAVDFFDAASAARELGSSFVFLMRGHAFNARNETRITGDRSVIDVTDYPEINHLCLASDVAVLDYSSLRFDYALTRKPMIFLTPDLIEYDRARGGVIPYSPTAPGPQAQTTDEVVHHLGDLEGLNQRYAAGIETFVHDYMELEDGHASQRLVDAVFVPRGDA